MSKAFPRIIAILVASFLLSTGTARAVMSLPSEKEQQLTLQLQKLERMGWAAFSAAWQSIQSTRDFLGVLLPSVDSETAAPVETVSIMLYAPNFRRYENFEFTMDGELVDRSQKDLRSFFRCKRSGRRHRMNPKVLAMLADLGKKYEGRVIEVVSGYRRKGFGAPRSKHFIGNAIDLRVRGIENTEIRDYLWHKYQTLGLGHYHKQDFIHMDYRPENHKIGWLQKRPTAENRYNPWWTKEGVEDPAILREARRALRAERRENRKNRRNRRNRRKTAKRVRASHDYYSLMQD